MAREHATIKLSIWNDDDYRDLSPAEQHLYKVLQTHLTLSYCGVADWRPRRMTGLARGWTVEDIEKAAAGLIERRFILVDESTEEVLVRSFVRHDGLMKQPRMATAMARAHAAVASRVLRGVIVHELQRLYAEDPDLKGWTSAEASALLSNTPIDHTTYPLGKGFGNPNGEGSVAPSEDPSEDPPADPRGNPSGEGKPDPSVKGSPTTATATATYYPEELRSSGSARKRAARPIPDDWAPTDHHRAYATEHSLDLDHEADQFRHHAAANDRRQADWHASFRTWLGKARPRPTPTPAAVDPDGGFQLPTPPKEVMDDPDPGAFARWARAQRDAWQADRDQHAAASGAAR